ncbi:MAG: hypothetical protein GY950_33360 [bacterium]|nr:hypothetical protein [bacterium]
MKWRKWNNIIHRDLGYFLVGLTIIYAVSGFVTNHLRDWDYNFITNEKIVKLENVSPLITVDQVLIDDILKQTAETENYKGHFRPAPAHLQIFLKGGIMNINMKTAQAVIERKKNRTVLREFNFLHLNHAGKMWTWVADFYAVGLFLLAITGLFVLKGKKGFSGRGKWFVIAGIIVPVVFLILYFY